MEPDLKPFNLFVYGTLMTRRLFRSVTGRDFLLPGEKRSSESKGEDQPPLLASHAVLSGYQKISPDGLYQYAAPKKGTRLMGLVLLDVPGELLEPLVRFEGTRYTFKRVRIRTRSGMVSARAFVGNEDQLQADFGAHWRSDLKHEHLFLDRIEDFLTTRVAGKQLGRGQTRKLLARAEQELRGETIRDLMEEHFAHGAVGNYVIHRELSQPPPSIKSLRRDPNATAVANNYLLLFVRQVILNQIEQKVREDFRFELEHVAVPEWFYEHTVSLLIALRILNHSPKLVDVVAYDCLEDLSFEDSDLVDYAAFGIAAADAIYSRSIAAEELARVRESLVGGTIPLGAELEFSNIGHAAVTAAGKNGKTRDKVYDAFRYFHQFGLNVLSWKVGGHVDDHRGGMGPERRGFLELAPGRRGDGLGKSRPVADDPWLMSQMIRQLVRYYDIRPHSLHLSLQLDSPPGGEDDLLPLSHVKCLLALAGGPKKTRKGTLRIQRVARGEIVHTDPSAGEPDSIALVRRLREKPRVGAEENVFADVRVDKEIVVCQYKFLRLSAKVNYEPIILALKGLQLKRPIGEWLTAHQVKTLHQAREMLDEILSWSSAPTSLGRREIDEFIEDVEEGLSIERQGRPAHKTAYLHWALDVLGNRLEEFNQLLE